jgi:hypothetical protein
MQMCERASFDSIRYLRISIRNDEQQLANAPLGPIQKKRLQKRIDAQKERLKSLNQQKQEKKRNCTCKKSGKAD